MNQKRFRELVENLQFPLCVVNARDELVYVNRCFVALFDYTLDDVPGLDAWWLRAYPDPAYRHWARETWDAAVAEARQTGRPIRSLEYRVTGKDGSVRYMEVAGIVLDDKAAISGSASIGPRVGPPSRWPFARPSRRPSPTTWSWSS